MSEDPVLSYLRERGSADHVVSGGLAGLIRSWQRAVEGLQANKALDFDDYLNDLDVRTLVHEVHRRFPQSLPLGAMRSLNLADWAFVDATSPCSECVWGESNAELEGWNRREHWWLYRLPPTELLIDPRD